MSSPIPQELITSIQEKKLIIWLGAGYSSKLLGFPNWQGLVERLADYYFEDNSHDKQTFLAKSKQIEYQNSPLSLLEDLKDKQSILLLKLPELFKIDAQSTDDTKFNPFRRLWEISDKIITTNYDRALEICHPLAEKIVYHKKHQLKHLLNKESFLFKLHGCIQEDPEHCLVFQEQYSRLYDDIQSTVAGVDTDIETEAKFLLKHLLIDHTILFIGYGITGDKPVDFLFQYIDKVIGEISGKKHFRISSKDDSLSKSYLNNIILPEGYSQLDDYLSVLTAYKPLKEAQSEQFDIFHHEYSGRQKELDELKSFIIQPEKHFLFVHGRGGIGKSHTIRKAFHETRTPFIYLKLKQSDTIHTVAHRLGIGYLPTADENIPHAFFVSRLQERKELIILDDFYEIEYEQVHLKNTLLSLANLMKGKVLLVSRSLPKEYAETGTTVAHLPIDLLKESEYQQFINSYVRQKHNQELSPELEQKVWEKSQGYPLISELLADLCISPVTPDFNIDAVEQWNFNEDSDGRKTVSRILDAVLKKGTTEEREFLFDMAIPLEALSITFIKQLPSYLKYGRDVFSSLIQRKHIIRRTDDEKFTVHALVRMLLQEKAGDRNETHAVLGRLYESQAVESQMDDMEAYQKAFYHFQKAGPNDLEDFIQRTDRFFVGMPIHHIVNKNNIEASIRRLNRRKESMEATNERCDPGTYNELAILYRLQGKQKECLELLDEGLKHAPSNSYLLFNKAYSFKRFGRIGEAVSLFELLANEKNEYAITQLAIISYINKDWKKCLEYCAVCLTNPICRQYQGMSYYQRREYDKAQAVFEEKIRDFGASAETLQYIGQIHYQRRDYDTAQAVFEQKIKDLGASAEALQYIGQIHYQRRDYDKAQAVFEQKIKDFGASVESLQYIGQIHYQRRDYDKAQAVFEQKIKDFGADAETLQYIGQIHYQRRDYDKAQAVFEQKIKDFGASAETYVYLGKCLIQTDPALAIEKLKEGDERFPKNYFIKTELATAYRINHDYEKAIAEYEEAIALLKTNVQSYNGLYKVYYDLSRYGDALEIVKRHIKNNLKDNRLLVNGIHLCIDYKYAILNCTQAREFLALLGTTKFPGKEEKIALFEERISRLENQQKK